MTTWNQLLGVLDGLFAYQHRQTSTVKKRGESFDNKTGERVIYLEYRVRMQKQANESGKPTLLQAILEAS